MDSIRAQRGVSHLIGFLIGVVILLVAIVPLFMVLTGSRVDIERVIENYQVFQDIRSLERLSIEADYTSTSDTIYYLVNTGSVSIKLVRALVNTGSGPTTYTLSISLEPGQRIPLSSIFSSLGLPNDPLSLIYLVSSRGSVFYIADQIIRVPPPISSTSGSVSGSSGSLVGGYVAGNPFTPSTSLFYWNFSSAIVNKRVVVYYSIGDSLCGIRGIPWVGYITGYTARVLTINSSPESTVIYNLTGKGYSGCGQYRFKDLLNVSGSYVVVIYYRFVVSSLSPTDRLSIDLRFSLYSSSGKEIGSSVTTFQWAPKTDLDYIVYSGYTVIPVFGTGVSGSVDLVVTAILTQINANGVYQIGLEYLAFQGVQVNPVSIG